MDVFDLWGVIHIKNDEVDEKLKDSSDKAKKWAKNIGGFLGNAAKVTLAGIGAAATGVSVLVKKSVEGFSEYEQLVGGVDTLFNRSELSLEEYAAQTGRSIGEVVGEYQKLNAGANTVMANAANAYKTAGLSANEYLETVTSFSASLLQSLGGDTEAAASYADMAITDMSDNANKMGSSMESIQSAYQGFAKQNYTMLDNLKLGYGGTKTEMERLILDAEKLNKDFKATRDKNGDLAMSYADIVDAIHIVQTDMGITGTTAKEASTTIQGSLGSMKAAWSNLLVGLSDDTADINILINNLVGSIIGENGQGGVLNNILPAVERALSGVSEIVTTAAPKIIPIVVDIIINNLPKLIDAGTKILVALIKGIAQALPELIKAIPEIVTAIIDGLKEAWPDIKAAGEELIDVLKQGALAVWEKIKSIGRSIIDGILEGLKNAWQGVKDWFSGAVSLLSGKASVGIETTGTGHAGGFDYVPYNGYPATLHKGEAVLTRSEADAWRSGQGGGKIVNINITTTDLDQSKVDYIIRRANQELGGALA